MLREASQGEPDSSGHSGQVDVVTRTSDVISLCNLA